MSGEACPRIFVVGTDTGVGKTVVSLLLMQRLFELGRDPIYLKPFQTGCASPRDADSDAAFVFRHLPALRAQDPASACGFCYRAPKAPYYAALDEGKSVDYQAGLAFLAARAAQARPLIIEAAGGLLVPISRTRLVIDLLADSGAAPVLVARAGLGTINHTLLSLEALRRRRLEPIAVVLVDGGAQPTPADLIADNREALVRLGGCRVLGPIPHLSDFSGPTEACRPILRELLPDPDR